MTRAMIIKDSAITVLAFIGAGITNLVGGWDKAMQTLLIFMAIDYVTGVLIAAVWQKSPKSTCGTLESKAAGKGLIRKAMYLVTILVAAQVDSILSLEPLTRDAAIIGFIGVEGMSIVENMGIMGVPLPEPVKKAFEVLKQKGDDVDPGGSSCQF